MAVDLSKLVSKRKITLDELNNRTIAVDAWNILYQFLSIIRGPDGNPLRDIHGNVTSHLSGVFYRNIELISHGISPIYVFDGIPSMLKQKTIEARMNRKRAAQEAYEKALAEGKLEEARMYAQGTVRMTKEIIESAKKLLEYMGIPFINAPSEGEAQASIMCKKGVVYAVASQDYDTMLFGAPLVVRNLNISGKRKLPKKNVYVNVEPEMLSFKDTTESLGLNQKQLIWIGILLGTDFNEGVKGVGPKTALKIVKGAKSIDDIKGYVKERYNTEFELDIREVESLFLNPEVKEVGEAELGTLMEALPNKEKIVKFMCDEHDFSRERIEKYTDRLMELRSASRQKGIGNWIK
ncbi:MAG: flap endonuclease-1 [Candidatus Micrarchaeales archaeon]|nr:flap endonuclease-1 [Candidatus Micrarchaeales archaeon]